MHRHDVLRLQDVVAVEQLSRCRVTRNVHLGIALVHDVCAELGQTINDSIDGVLVARNQRTSQDNGVALTDFDIVLEICHAS